MIRALLAGVAVVVLSGCAQRNAYTFREMAMGTECAVTVHAEDAEEARSAARAALDRIHAIDEELSDWLPDGVVQRLPLEAGTAVVLPNDLCDALSESLVMSEATDGLFDVTIGPAVRLWRTARTSGHAPSAAEISTALNAVGWRKVRVNRFTCTANFDAAGIRLDFGAIGKGFAADEALATLIELGHADSLIAIAGDIRAGDAPPDRHGWRVQVDDGIAPPSTITLVRGAVSTSGPREQSALVDGVRVGHILDPRTGCPVVLETSATVIAANATFADALASALCVAGPASSQSLVSRAWLCAGSLRDTFTPPPEARVSQRSGPQAPDTVAWTTQGFPKWTPLP